MVLTLGCFCSRSISIQSFRASDLANKLLLIWSGCFYLNVFYSQPIIWEAFGVAIGAMIISNKRTLSVSEFVFFSISFLLFFLALAFKGHPSYFSIAAFAMFPVFFNYVVRRHDSRIYMQQFAFAKYNVFIFQFMLISLSAYHFLFQGSTTALFDMSDQLGFFYRNACDGEECYTGTDMSPLIYLTAGMAIASSEKFMLKVAVVSVCILQSLLIGKAMLTIALVVIASRASWPLALALMPYQIWVSIASFLSWTYARLN